MRHDTTPSGLPYVLFVALVEPTGVLGEHVEDLRGSSGSGFDGACRIVVAEKEIADAFVVGRFGRERHGGREIWKPKAEPARGGPMMEYGIVYRYEDSISDRRDSASGIVSYILLLSTTDRSSIAPRSVHPSRQSFFGFVTRQQCNRRLEPPRGARPGLGEPFNDPRLERHLRRLRLPS